MYTDRPSYLPTDTVRIFANWDLPLDSQGAPLFPNGRKVRYHVRKVDRWQPGGLPFVPNDPTQDVEGEWIPNVHDTASGSEPVHLVEQVPPMGSFIEGFSNANGALSLGGYGEFTIEGWIYPTQIYDDAVVIAGQGECLLCDLGSPTDYTDSTFSTRGAYLGIDEDGFLTAVVDAVDAASNPIHMEAIHLERLEPRTWYYVAAVFDGKGIYVRQAKCDPLPPSAYELTTLDDTTCEPIHNGLVYGYQTQIQKTVNASLLAAIPFRVGARKEAPGGIGDDDFAGLYDGRIDRLRVWSSALSTQKLQVLMNQGGTKNDDPGIGWNPDTDPTLELFLDFEDPYLSDLDGDGTATRMVEDTSGNDRHGTVYNHGTPGVTGRPLHMGTGLRLNHDQVFDARFDDVVYEIDLSVDVAGNSAITQKSGYYVVQAVLEDESGGFVASSPENNESNHFTSFVVTPGDQPGDPRSSKRVAAILPVYTWLAYNSWPGAGFSQISPTWNIDPVNGGEYPNGAAVGVEGLNPRHRAGLDPDDNPTLLLNGQGGNSCYAAFGGGSVAHFMGWNRPMPKSSIRFDYQAPLLTDPDPVNPLVRSENGAALDMIAIGWLTDPVGDGSFSYEPDLYTDYDLDLDPDLLDPVHYDLVVLLGHPEYVSRSMLQALHEFLDAGGNLVTIGGNSITWRSEGVNVPSSYEVPAQGGGTMPLDHLSLEVKKWPETQTLGQRDRQSMIAMPDPTNPHEPEGRTGAWRVLHQTWPSGSPAPPGPAVPGLGGYLDLIQGTTVDNAGIRRGGDACETAYHPQQRYGLFQPTMSGAGAHWLLDDKAHWLTPPESTGLTGDWSAVGRVVGNESDSFFCHNDYWIEYEDLFLGSACISGIFQGFNDPGCPPDPPPVITPGPKPLFAYSQFIGPSLPINLPFSANGQVAVLARGVSYEPQCFYNVVSFCAPIVALTQPELVDFSASRPAGANPCYGDANTGDENDGHASITYYQHTGGGRVLALGAIDAARGLVAAEIAPGVGTQLRTLTREAIDCMLDEQLCGDRHGDPVYPQEVARPQYQEYLDVPNGQPCEIRPVHPFPFRLNDQADAIGVGDLLIVEMMTDPLAPDDEQWLEIYNNSATSSSIALDGLTLWIDGEVSILSTTQVLAPGQVAVIARDSNGIVDGDLTSSTVLVDVPGFRLDDSAGVIEIRTMRTHPGTMVAEDAFVCRLVYDSNGAFPSNVAGVSRAYDMDLSGANAEADACLMRDLSKWCSSTVAFGSLGELGTPGTLNPSCP